MREYLSVTKAIADASRARILKLLERKPLCLCQIVAVLGLRPSTVSKHLAILRKAGLIEFKKTGKWVFNALSQQNSNTYNQTVLALFRAWLNEDNMVKQDRSKLDRILRIPLEKLCKRQTTS